MQFGFVFFLRLFTLFFIVVLCVKTTHLKRKSKPTRSHSNIKCRSRDSLTMMDEKKKKSHQQSLKRKKIVERLIGKSDTMSLVRIQCSFVLSFSRSFTDFDFDSNQFTDKRKLVTLLICPNLLFFTSLSLPS